VPEYVRIRVGTHARRRIRHPSSAGLHEFRLSGADIRDTPVRGRRGRRRA
jgi:hypothetical protein